MKGLLDIGDDPLTFGLLGAASALLTPGQRGGFGPALMAFPQALTQANEYKRQKRKDELQEKYIGAQIKETEAQAQERAAKIAEAARKAQGAASFWSGVLQPGKAPEFNPQMILAGIQAGVDPAHIKAAMESPNWGKNKVARIVDIAGPDGSPMQQAQDEFGNNIGVPFPKPVQASVHNTGTALTGINPYTMGPVGQQIPLAPKVGRVVDVIGPDGSPMQQQLDEFGKPVGEPFRKPVEMRTADTGNSIVGFNPFTGSPTGLKLPKSMTPGEMASNQVALGNLEVNRGQLGVSQGQLGVARGNLAVNQGRLALDQTSPRGVPMDTGNGPILVDPRTGNASPVTVGGRPVPPKMSDSQANQLRTIDAEISTIDGALRAVKNVPTAFGFARGAATMAGSTSETIAGRFDSPQEREARSYVYNIVSKAINERAGAAQSAQELQRLRSFLPAEMDTAQQIKDKLDGYKKFLQDRRKGFESPAGGNTIRFDAQGNEVK